MTIDEFCEELEKTKESFKWGLAQDEQLIRATRDGLEYCPITAVLANINPEACYIDEDHMNLAGFWLGLDYDTKYGIVYAADCVDNYFNYNKIREKLLVAVGL